MKLFTVVLIGGVLLGGALLLSSSSDSVELKGKRIFLLGDSISVGKTSVGGRLAELLEDAGFDVEVNALGGRSANTFIDGTKKLKEPSKGLEQLEDVEADTAVIFLGTNCLAGLQLHRMGSKGLAAQLSSTKKNFSKIIKALKAKGIKVVGIGAPHYPEREEFWPYEPMLKEALEGLYGEGNFIDAGPLTGSYRMHAQGVTAEKFAKKLFDALGAA